MADTPHATTDLRYAHILSFVTEHPWAVTRPMLQTIAGILGRRAAGLHATQAEIAAALTNRKTLPQPTGGPVAVIPVYGVLVPRSNLMSEMSGGTSFDVLTAQLREALGTAAVKTIVFDVDSPGGSVAGATEFAREVLRARTKKPIVAIANYTMASAAYWLASCATEIVASPSAEVGSVGVYTIHEDLSKALAMAGIKETFIAAGKYKVEGNDAEPLGPEAAAYLQQRVDEAYGLFCQDISRGRGTPLDEVRGGFGQGRTVSAQEALTLGMVDKIATFDATLARLMSGAPDATRQAAHASGESVCPACNGSGLKPERFMSDPQGQEPCPTCNGSGKTEPSPVGATAQEPSRVTAQERAARIRHQNALKGALLEFLT